MHVQGAISRRRLLATAAAAGSLALAGGGRGAFAQAQGAKRIEQFAPELDAIISTSEPVLELAGGTGGPLGPTEGPVWIKEGGYLLYSDISGDRRMKYLPGQGASVFQEKNRRANGLTRDLQGRIVACERETRRVTRQELDGSITVIAATYQGKQLNIPNDVVVKSDGAIYFSDPLGNAIEQWDLGYPGVYRVSPDLGTITLLVNDFVFPNGLAFSPDESVLYIDDFSRRLIRAFDVARNGTLMRQTDRIFADLNGPESGWPDGMKVDTAGNVYCGGSGGIYILDPKGKKLGRIVHGHPETTNVAFGGDDWKTLYFTTHDNLGSVKVKIPGVPVPVAKKV
jgi:gluconolactonase